MSIHTPGRVAYTNARLLDPASGLDAHGRSADRRRRSSSMSAPACSQAACRLASRSSIAAAPALPPVWSICACNCANPARSIRKPCSRPADAAVAGGVTSMVCLPNTDPVIDDVATMEFVARRARKNGLAKVYPYGAVTKGLEGKELAEIGMLAEAGALGFTDGTNAIENALTMRRGSGLCRHLRPVDRPASGRTEPGRRRRDERRRDGDPLGAWPASPAPPRPSCWNATCVWWRSPAAATTPPMCPPPRASRSSARPRPRVWRSPATPRRPISP